MSRAAAVAALFAFTDRTADEAAPGNRPCGADRDGVCAVLRSPTFKPLRYAVKASSAELLNFNWVATEHVGMRRRHQEFSHDE